jgi:CRISP-associated protein Cas1
MTLWKAAVGWTFLINFNKMQIVLDTYGLALSTRNHCFLIRSGQVEKLVSPHRVTALLIVKNCRISSNALQLAAAHEVPVLIADATGRIAVKTWSGQYRQQALLRRRQVLFATEPACLQYVKELLQQKAANQLLHIKKLQQALPAEVAGQSNTIIEKMEAGIHQLAGIGGLLQQQRNAARGAEAFTTKYYWLGIKTVVQAAIECKGRSKRPAKDPFNALLNYNYGMLYGKVETAIHTLGLDPQLGFFHLNKYNSKTLVFDMIEPFRPWADEMLTAICLAREHQATWFEEKNGGWWLAQAGRRFIISRFNQYWNERVQYNGQLTTRSNHILREVQKLTALLANVDATE